MSVTPRKRKIYSNPHGLPKNKRQSVRFNEDLLEHLKKEGWTLQSLIDAIMLDETNWSMKDEKEIARIKEKYKKEKQK